MPRGPKGEKRPADVVGNAVHIMRIATGEIEEGAGAPPDDGKNPGRRGAGAHGWQGASQGAVLETALRDSQEGRFQALEARLDGSYQNIFY
jgi:hypothetical protein